MTNQITIPITIVKGIRVAQVVAVSAVPQVEVVPRTLEEPDEVQGIQWTKMSVEGRREVLFQQLDLSGLGGWSKGNRVATYTLLAKYHDIFSLKPAELGCTDRVVDDEPFKEWFQRIPPPIVDEVWTDVKEMLEVGAIHHSQSP